MPSKPEVPSSSKGRNKTVRIGTGLLESVKDFLKTDEAMKMGLDSDKDVVHAALLDFLKTTGYFSQPSGSKKEESDSEQSR